MGLKALKDNIEYISFTIKEDDWFLVKKDDEFKSNLIMPCCNERAIMKNSSLGLQYFSHYRKGSCTYTGESIEHLMLKKEIYEILIKQNYKVEIEKNLQFDDYLIRPDIYLELDGYKIAFEIQVSNQSLDTVNERTKKYADRDIIVVWLNLFTNRTYNYTYFNKNNTNAKMYEVNYYNTVFKYNGNSIESLILNGINETLEETIKIENQSKNFISISGSNYYINNHYKVNDKYRIFTKDDDYFIKRKEEDRIEPIEIFFIKGFITNSEIVNVNINKKLINEKKSLDPVIGEVKKPIKVKDIEDTIIDAANSLGWEVTKNYLNKIDLLLSKEHYKVAIIKNIKQFEDIKNECIKRKIELVFLDSIRRLSFFKKNIQAYAFDKLSNFIIDFDGKKYSAYTFFINKLTQTQEGYPFDKISQIELSNYLTPIRGDNYRFDQDLLDSEPNIIFNQVNIVNKNSIIDAYYLSGFIKYDMKLVL